jgi:hypothetical protein
MMTTPVAESQFALELEAELDEYSDERGMILIEAAWSWRGPGAGRVSMTARSNC